MVKKEVETTKVEFKEVLFIKPKTMIKPDHMAAIRSDIIRQLPEGVVMIPPYIDAEIIRVPEDIEVRISE